MVTTLKNTVDHVVTEYGVADMRGRSISERAAALIRIAHPRFRDELTAEARGSTTSRSGCELRSRCETVRLFFPARRTAIHAVAVDVRMRIDVPLHAGYGLHVGDALDLIEREAKLDAVHKADDTHR